MGLQPLDGGTPTPSPININVEPSGGPGIWEELGAPLGAVAGAAVGALGAIGAGRFTAKRDDRRQTLAEQQRQDRQRREDTISSIEHVLTKIGQAWTLCRNFDDRRLGGEISQADHRQEASKAIEALTDVAIAKGRLPTAALEDLADNFVTVANRVVRQPLSSRDPGLREEMNLAVANFEQATKPVLREAKYGHPDANATSKAAKTA
jgi:hypothetical protein